jgi:septal ring-binding cell division protein DamX
MLRLSAPLLAFAMAAIAALALSACGGGGADLLPGKTASEIETNLDQVAQLAGEGECVGAENAAQEVSAEIEGLGGVDDKLKQALSEGASRLNEVVANCEEEPAEEEIEPVEEEELEPAEKAEKHEKAEKPAKPDKEETEVQPEEPEEATPPAGGKGKGAENGEGPEGTGPPGQTEPPSGGVGPGTAVESEGG